MAQTRRDFLITASATGAAGLWLPLGGASQVVAQTAEARLFTLSDGHLTLPAEFVFAPVVDRDVAGIVAERGIADITAPLESPCNISILQTVDRVVLFDAGAGFSFQPTVGRLIDALAQAGLGPEAVTDVVFTHAHPDHLWGVLDDFDDPTFINAQHWMGAAELDYWRDPDTVGSIGDLRASFAVGAARRLDSLGDAITTFEDQDEILPGILAHLTPGHTPGHMSFEVEVGGTRTMILGDAIANPHIALARPDWPSGTDQDEALGATTRARLVQRLAAEDMAVIGFHLPGSGLGRIERMGDGYAFVEES